MLKNKFFQKLYIGLLAVLLCTADRALAAHNLQLIAPQSVSTKLIIAACGVAGVLFVIFIALTVHKKFAETIETKSYQLNKNSLKSPQDKEEAILMYLAKNKLN